MINSITIPESAHCIGSISILTSGVVEALALKDVGVEGGGRAHVGVAVADTPPTHTDLLDGVVVPAQFNVKFIMSRILVHTNYKLLL